MQVMGFAIGLVLPDAEFTVHTQKTERSDGMLAAAIHGATLDEQR